MSWYELLKDDIKTCGDIQYFESTVEVINFYESSMHSSKTDKVIDILTRLHYCDCCDRHQLDKPPIISDVKCTCHNYHKNCSCDCRHLSRLIRRFAKNQTS